MNYNYYYLKKRTTKRKILSYFIMIELIIGLPCNYLNLKYVDLYKIKIFIILNIYSFNNIIY